MPTILTKRSNTASSVPVAGDLTNSTLGAELAVNTADKRLFTKDSGGTVVELGTNPSSLTLPSGTASGVAYLNGSKVLTTGSALTFDGTALRNTSGQFEGIDSLTLSALVSGTNSTVVTINSAGTSGTTRFQINGSEQMRLTSTGLGIGTTAPQSRLSVRTSDTYAATFNTNTASNGLTLLSIGSYQDAAGGTGGSVAIGAANNHSGSVLSSLVFYTYDGTFVEKARIDSSGNLLCGLTATAAYLDGRLNVQAAGTQPGICAKTDPAGSTTQFVYSAWAPFNSGNNVFMSFETETTATIRGSISYNRGVGLTAYNTTSDYRAKDILGPIENSGSVIDSVPVYMGKMKGATQERPMFIAHETPPYAHTGEKDAVDEDGNPIFQQMDASALVPVMWAELKSLRTRMAASESIIEQLKADVAALKGA